MEPVSHIAVVEDDPDISRMMVSFMTEHGFQVTPARTGRDLDRVMSSGNKVDLVILDVGLPGEDGLSICRRLRGKSTIPIIMVTARDADTDRIVGLEVGADDYLPKPFNPRELLARMRAVLRRQDRSSAPPSVQLRVQDLELDGAARKVLKAGKKLDLTDIEFGLLEALMR